MRKLTARQADTLDETLEFLTENDTMMVEVIIPALAAAGYFKADPGLKGKMLKHYKAKSLQERIHAAFRIA